MYKSFHEVYLSMLQKSAANGDVKASVMLALQNLTKDEFELLKDKLIERLNKHDKAEKAEIKKALHEFDPVISIAKATGRAYHKRSVGEKFTLNGQTYIKVSEHPAKYKPYYESNSRGAKLAAAAIEKKIRTCKTPFELANLVKEQRQRFGFVNESEFFELIQSVKGKTDKKAAKASTNKPAENNRPSIVTRRDGVLGKTEKEISYTNKKREKLFEKLKNSLGEVTNLSSGIKANLSKKSLEKMSSEKAIEKSKDNGFTVDEHFEVAEDIIDLYKNSKLIVSHKNLKNPDDPNILSIKRFVANTKLSNGTDIDALITVKESKEHGHRIYSLELDEINKASDRFRSLGDAVSEETNRATKTPYVYETNISQSEKKSISEAEKHTQEDYNKSVFEVIAAGTSSFSEEMRNAKTLQDVNDIIDRKFSKKDMERFNMIQNAAVKWFEENKEESNANLIKMKNNNKLTEKDIKNLKVVSNEEFSKVIDAIMQNDYRNIPNIIKLPDINHKLAAKLGLTNASFLLKSNATHIRPSRKGNYGQDLTSDEYKKIPEVIKNADFVIIDKLENNFQIVFDDEKDDSKINKIVFNKTDLGNWIVTVGKIDRSSIGEGKYKIVGVGVAPTISELKVQPATRLRPSPTNYSNNTTKPENVNSKSESEKHQNRSEAMKGNQNAYKGMLSDSKVQHVKKMDYEVYEDYNTDSNVFAAHHKDGKFKGISMSKDVAEIIDSMNPGFDGEEETAQKINEKYPKVKKTYVEQMLGYIYMGVGKNRTPAKVYIHDNDELLENNKKKFSDLTVEEKKQKKEQIENNIVSSIQADSVPYNNDGAYDDAAAKWIENHGNESANTLIGEVVINEKSGKRDMHHGDEEDKYLKLQTIPSVKDVLEKGTYLGYEKDFNGKPIDNHYFAGKINYGEEEKIIFCRVRENKGDKNRFYVHEVFTEEEIKKEVTTRTSSPSLLRFIGKPLYEFILRDVLNVNKNSIETIKSGYSKAKSITGNKKTLHIGNEKIKCHYKIVEAETPTASHDEKTYKPTAGFPTTNGTTANDRNYETDKDAQESVRNIAAEFDGRAISDCPIVTKDGIVLSGNNRTMSSKLAASKGTDKAYLESLKEECEDYGFEPDDLKGFKHPRIILEMDEYSGNYSTQDFAKFNKDEKKTMNNTEKAVKTSKIIKENQVQSVADVISEYDTLSDVYNNKKAAMNLAATLVQSGIIERNELAQYYTEDEGFSPTGKDFVENTLVGSVLNESNIRGVASEGGKVIRQKLVRAILPLIENKGTGNEYSFNNELNDAVKIAVEVSKNHDKYKDVKEYVSQGSLFGDKVDDLTAKLAEIIHDSSQKDFSEKMKSINAGLRPAAAGQFDMFCGECETKESVLSRFLGVHQAVKKALASVDLSKESIRKYVSRFYDRLEKGVI